MTKELPEEDWATVITGSELLSRVIKPVAQDGEIPTDFPKLLHQSWKTHDIPSKFLAWSNTWRSHHNGTDGWEQVIWSDEDNAKLVMEEFPEWLDLYNALGTSIHKADFCRPLYMHRFGGVYADLDVISLLPTSTILSRLPSASTGSSSSKIAYLGRMDSSTTFLHSLPNAWFASGSPGHPYWIMVIDYTRDAIERGEARGVEWVTGPVADFKAEERWRETQESDDNEYKVEILPEHLIFPHSWQQSWNGPADIGRCNCASTSHFFNMERCRDLFPQAGALTFWTHSWAGMVGQNRA